MFIVSRPIRCEIKPQKITAKPQHWLVTTWHETMSWLFLLREIVKFFFLDFGFGRIDMNDILRIKKSGSVDQTQLDSASENMKNWANHKQCFSVFVLRAVQKVMLLGCDWWFSIRIFLQLRNLYPWREPVPLQTFTICTVNSRLGQFGSLVFEQTVSSG